MRTKRNVHARLHRNSPRLIPRALGLLELTPRINRPGGHPINGSAPVEVSEPCRLTQPLILLKFSAMKPKRGPVQTFSVAVDARTKKILRAHADRLFEGNMSALISAFGREAEKRDATAWLIQDAGGSVLTDELRQELAAEFHQPKKRRRRAA